MNASDFIEITLRYGCSPANFQNTFSWEHLWRATSETFKKLNIRSLFEIYWEKKDIKLM